MRGPLPHEIFAAIHEQFPAKFQEKFTGPAGAIETFWADMEGHPALDAHPMKAKPDWNRMTVPLSVHGDGVPVAGIGKSWARLLDVYSWASLVGSGGTLDSMMLIYVAFVHLLTQETMQKMWHIVCWSFRCLASGRWPSHDAYGRAYPPGSPEGKRAGRYFAGGYRAVLFVIRGDLDYFAKCLQLNHYGSLHPCCRCPANSTEGDPLCWTDFRPTHSQWMQEQWDPDDWNEAHPGRHQIFHIPSVTIRCVYMDWLHVKHLGVDQYAYGSVLWLLCYRVMAGVQCAQ